MGSFSIWHWMIVLVVILIVFGAGRLPRVMGDLAKGIKSFKAGMKDEEAAEAVPPAPVTPAPIVTTAAAAAPAAAATTASATPAGGPSPGNPAAGVSPASTVPGAAAQPQAPLTGTVIPPGSSSDRVA